MTIVSNGPPAYPSTRTTRSPHRIVRSATAAVALLAGLLLVVPAASAGVTPDSGPFTGGTEVTVPVPGADSFIQISGGDYHSLALDADGNLWSWGRDNFGQVGNGATTGDVDTPTQVTTGTDYTIIAAGTFHSLALDTDGNLWTWGNDGNGQLGNGATTGDVTAPTQVATGTTFTTIAAGDFHSLALDVDGNLWAWGSDFYGQVGNGAPVAPVTSPTQVTTGVDYSAIAAGASHSIALDTDGNFWTWGDDGYGQVGNGATTGNVTTPTQITTGAAYTAIAAGNYHSLALDTAGNAWTWGNDDFGQVGNGATTGNVTSPTQVPTSTTYAAIAGGAAHSLALDAAGNLWTWGYDDFGQVGNGATTGNVTSPTQVPTSTTYTAIAGGLAHSLALDTDGNPWTWGRDDYGQAGNGPATGDIETPTHITTGTSFTTIAADRQSLALDADGNLWTWGLDASGQVGNGATTGTVTTPTQVTTGTEYTAVTAGRDHSLALDADGNLWTWGSDNDGQVGNGATTGTVTAPIQITTGTEYTAIAGGFYHSLALDTAGNLWTWGDDGYGQVGNGATTGDITTPTQITTGTSFTTIAAGQFHSLALDADGNLWSWGNDTSGQVGNGATTGDVDTPTQVTTGTEYTAIVGGYSHSLALDTDGNLWTWGSDSDGQVGNGAITGDVDTPTHIATDTNYTSIATGDRHGLAIDADGSLWTWGNDTSGQVGNGATTGDVDTPTQITIGTTYATVAAGFALSLALDADGNLWTWGDDLYGSLGNGATTGISTTPTRLGGTTIITGVSFDGVPGTGLERLTETLASVTTPAGTPGTATVTIHYSFDGQIKPDLTLVQRFTYLALEPGAPTGLAAIAGDSEVALSWTTPASDGGDAITDYLIEFSDNGGTTWSTFADSTTTATTATVTGLTNGTAHTFRVSAINTAGTSTPSATATATPVAPSAPPATGGSGGSSGGNGGSRGGGNAETGSAPTITTQPGDVTAEVGDNVTLTVAVAGSDVPMVQWQLSTDDGATWTSIGGETGRSLVLTATNELDGTRYRAVVSNEFGATTSQSATLTVAAAPVAEPSPTPTPQPSPSPEPRTHEADSGIPSWLWIAIGLVLLVVLALVLIPWLTRRRAS